MTMESIAKENRIVLQTTFKNSPKTPRYQSTKNIISSSNSRLQLLNEDSLPNENSACPYNIIEYCGNTTLNVQTNNDGLDLDNQSNTDSAFSPEYSDEKNNVFGITVKCTRQKIMFVIPEQLASFIEIMKIPFEASTLESGQSSCTNGSFHSSGISSTIGPVRSTNKNKNHRWEPYYSNKYNKNTHKETYKSQSYKNTDYNIPVFNNKVYNNESRYRASTPVQTSSKNDRNRNQYFRKPYNNSRYTSIRKCWNCNGVSHLYRNCPLPQIWKFCRRCGSPGVITKNCRKCYRL